MQGTSAHAVRGSVYINMGWNDVSAAGALAPAGVDVQPCMHIIEFILG
jgi:hypothetical protein